MASGLKVPIENKNQLFNKGETMSYLVAKGTC